MTPKSSISAFLIAGPTASGKSALAIRLAERFNGCVINADSMQVYRDLTIITARPEPQDLTRAPHELFGHIDGRVNYSVGFWLKDVAACLSEVRARGQRPILIGGTGLYFKALTQGISNIPPVPEAVREALRAQYQGLSAAQLHERLAKIDPAMAQRLRPSDSQRLMRALEVKAATGRSLLEFQGQRSSPLLDITQCLPIFLAPERAELNARINARFDQMIAQGALAEVEQLATRGLDPALPVMRAHGVPGLIAYLKGQASQAEAIEKGKRDTRHYAKRQFTFIRHQLPHFHWMPPLGAEAQIEQLLPPE
ncbi:MAG: tRNA (adenosine(37)-N6)-dimethylallyltransferase MiaA [Alphaproteobacteria bacterium]|nr:tRNA (adenosine(37)-N6)-dimethylallyltransferase MiaA [Alphaproteobacteria bacterium]